MESFATSMQPGQQQVVPWTHSHHSDQSNHIPRQYSNQSVMPALRHPSMPSAMMRQMPTQDVRPVSHTHVLTGTALSKLIPTQQRLTREQHLVLEAHFTQQNKPSTAFKKQIAEGMHVPLDKINVSRRAPRTLSSLCADPQNRIGSRTAEQKSSRKTKRPRMNETPFLINSILPPLVLPMLPTTSPIMHLIRRPITQFSQLCHKTRPILADTRTSTRNPPSYSQCRPSWKACSPPLSRQSSTTSKQVDIPSKSPWPLPNQAQATSTWTSQASSPSTVLT